MRLILVTGKGGAGTTTTSAATALGLAARGIKTLLVCTAVASLLDVRLSGEPTQLAPGLDAVQLDAQSRLEAGWPELASYLLAMSRDLEPVEAGELSVLPGLAELLTLLAVRDLAASGQWQVLVLDCGPAAQALRMLALPETLSWYLRRLFPIHRKLAGGVRSLIGGGANPPSEDVFDGAMRLAEQLGSVQAMLADPAVTSVRLVLTPQAADIAETRRSITALALYGYRVQALIANRVFPAGEQSAMSDWQRGWLAAQTAELAELAESCPGVPIRRIGYRAAEPIGVEALRQVGAELSAEAGETGAGNTETAVGQARAMAEQAQLITVTAGAGSGLEQEFVLTLSLPLLNRAEVQASRSADELIVTVAGHRRVLALPSVLRRCQLSGATASTGKLVLRFRPDPQYWRQM